MKNLTCALLISLAVVRAGAAPDIWRVIQVDPARDGRDASLPDAAQLSYQYDKGADLLWFRVTLHGNLNADAFSVSIAADTGAPDADKVNWWQANKAFTFDRLITAWVTKVNGTYRGTIGVTDAAGARQRNLTSLHHDNLHIRADADAIVIGVKRTDITDQMQMRVIAAVGVNESWNDDIPNAGFGSIDLAAPRPTRGISEIDVNRNNLRFESSVKTISPATPASSIKSGRGDVAMILIPGVYSGEHAFDGFIRRHESRCRCYVLTPPGLNRTAPRPLPPERVSYGEFTWTRSLERDILSLIKREKLDKPVIVAHGFPGSLAAREIAAESPNALGGIVEIAGIAVQPAFSFINPGKPASPEERIAVVDTGWAQKWFKFVTPDTWESNNYPAAMLANDIARADAARMQLEAAPLPVKIRYLIELMASDHTGILNNLKVPMLVLRPGFDDTTLADPVNRFFKTFFLDSWDPFASNPRIKMITLPGARVLILDDQPVAADEAIAAFIATWR